LTDHVMRSQARADYQASKPSPALAAVSAA
jgi:hypothetical protein